MKYEICLIKAYFERGYGVTGYLKYVIVLLGFDRVLKGDLKTSMFIILGWGLFCLLFGYLWYKLGFIEEENEVNNRFNPFQREVREAIKNKNI